MKRIVIIVLMTLTVILTSACSKKQEIDSEQENIINITKEGEYIFDSTLDKRINVKSDGKIKIILDGVNIEMKNYPFLNVEKGAVTVYLKEGSLNKIEVENPEVKNNKTNSSVIYSNGVIAFEGTGKLEITSVDGNGIYSKSDCIVNSGEYNIKGVRGITSGNYIEINKGNIVVEASDNGVNSNGNIVLNDGIIKIKADNDAINAKGLIEVNGGKYDLESYEGFESTTLKINDGIIKIKSIDDGLSVGKKTPYYEAIIEINGSDIDIETTGDKANAIDANGSLYIKGGKINIKSKIPFEYYDEAIYSDGELIVNGVSTKTITGKVNKK